MDQKSQGVLIEPPFPRPGFLLSLAMAADVGLILLYCFEDNHELCFLSVLWTLVSQASLWFATFLSVLYCSKITAFKRPAYL